MCVYSVLKNCQPGKLPARIDFLPNKPLSTPDRTYILSLHTNKTLNNNRELYILCHIDIQYYFTKAKQIHLIWQKGTD